MLDKFSPENLINIGKIFETSETLKDKFKERIN